MQRRITFDNHLCIGWSIRMVYFSVCNQVKKKNVWKEIVIYVDFALCIRHLKQESDTAKKRLKALKINTPEICKYLFNIICSVKHICVCSCSWPHLILSTVFPPLFTALPYRCDHIFSSSRTSEVLTLQLISIYAKKGENAGAFFEVISLNRVMLLNGNTFTRFLFNTNHQNDLCNKSFE
jgi:hypothetical protein